MSRADKGRAIARYLTGSSGIPLISWDTASGDLLAPSPYFFTATTDAASWRFWEKVKDLPDKKVSAVIRYDKWIDNTADAVAGIRLSTLGVLLSAHYEMNDRKERD